MVVTQSTYTVGEDFTGAAAVVSDLGEPERPFTLIRGASHGHHWVGPGLLRAWAGDAPFAAVTAGA
ncbi:MAG TPA: hypothetical protein DIC36_07455 [Gammaproteobacteria bacterium]|nr:hypothetical protein [Gammaproteobacteria bacterium]